MDTLKCSRNNLVKRVSFNELKNEVYHIDSHHDCRSKFWEFVAVDRVRFHDRIINVSCIINPVLDHNHRYKVYMQRFK